MVKSNGCGLSNTLFKMMRHNAVNTMSNVSQWYSHLKHTLESLGFGNIWDSQEFPNIRWLKNATKQRMKDIFLQSWFKDLEKSSIGRFYSQFKNKIELEEYLVLLDFPLKSYLTKLRFSMLTIPISTGRFDNIPYEERYCYFCGEDELGDEYHVILFCKKILEIREKYIPEYFRKYANIGKLMTLITSKNKPLLVKLSAFIKQISKIIQKEKVSCKSKFS